MHYAQSFSCKEKLKDRPEVIVERGSGVARQRIRDDKTLSDHDRITWEYSGKVLRIPPNLSDEVCGCIVIAYIEGREDGDAKGRRDLQSELRDLIGAECAE